MYLVLATLAYAIVSRIFFFGQIQLHVTRIFFLGGGVGLQNMDKLLKLRRKFQGKTNSSDVLQTSGV